MNSISFQRPQCLLAAAVLTLTALCESAKAQTVILSEDWQAAGMATGDINSATNAPLTGWIGVSFNGTNPVVSDGAQGGNVLRDQGGFGGTYGSGDNAGNATRVRSSNGAMLNKDALQLASLGASSVTFSFDLRQNTANYHQVVEFSTDADFTAPILLDTFTGDTNLGLWIAKTYTLVDGVDATFTDASYFRIRKLRPSPGGTNGGANSTNHTYDNLVIEYAGGGPDITPPTVASTVPAVNAMDVAIDEDLIATFSEPIDLTGTGTVTLRNVTLGSGSDVVITLPDAQVTASGAADLVINPTADLDLNTDYAVQISADAVVDQATSPNPFAGILNDTTWFFKTPVPDTTAPTLDSFANNVSDGPIFEAQSVTYTVTFSEGMNASTVEVTDFENASATGVTIDSVTATGDPAVFTVLVSPTEAGTIQLQVKVGAVLEDLATSPNQLDTASAITDPVIITVNAGAPTILLFEDWQTTGMVSGDINSATNAPLTGWIGVSFNDDNPIVSDGAQGGNVLRDQTGFGGTYGSADSAGNATRVRSSNGAMLNKAPLQLVTLGATAVTFSFDLRQGTANYVQVVEFSTDADFTAPILLDTIDGDTNLGLWIAKSYTLTDGVEATFTNDAYFRIRKLRPSPVGTNGGANSTSHTYDNLKIEINGGTGGGNDYSDWITGFPGVGGLTGFDDDADFDGNDNGLENFFGTDPSVFSAGVVSGVLSGNTFTFTHPQSDTPADDLAGPDYTWSTDLATFNTDGVTVGLTTVDFASVVSAGVATVTATITGTIPADLFVRVGVTQVVP